MCRPSISSLAKPVMRAEGGIDWRMMPRDPSPAGRRGVEGHFGQAQGIVIGQALQLAGGPLALFVEDVQQGTRARGGEQQGELPRGDHWPREGDADIGLWRRGPAAGWTWG